MPNHGVIIGGAGPIAPSSLVCANGQTLNASGVCACPTGQGFNASGVCGALAPTCTGGQFYNISTSSCTCPTGTAYIPNGSGSFSCQTPPTCYGGQYYNASIYSCTCPSGQYWDGSACLTPPPPPPPPSFSYGPSCTAWISVPYSSFYQCSVYTGVWFDCTCGTWTDTEPQTCPSGTQTVFGTGPNYDAQRVDQIYVDGAGNVIDSGYTPFYPDASICSVPYP